jgi:hypothetical protein
MKPLLKKERTKKTREENCKKRAQMKKKKT